MSQISLLHEHLVRDASKKEVKRLLLQNHDILLRTLENEPSCALSGSIKMPAFQACRGATDGTLATLLDLDERATALLLAQFKRVANNDHAVLTGTTVRDESLMRDAELALLRHAHTQRCLLLRCVYRLLAVAYDTTTRLHAVACGEVALLLQSRMPERIVELIPTLRGPTRATLCTRLPSRLRGYEATVSMDRQCWLDEVSSLLAVQAAREQCEALGLLVLMRYMPLHHTSDPHSRDQLSDLISYHAGGACFCGATDALYALLAGCDVASVASLTSALAPLLAPAARPGAPSSLVAWERRAEKLATIAVMAAMHAEKEFCQMHAQPLLARTPAAYARLAEFTRLLRGHGRQALRNHGAPGGSALGSLLITWCNVLLEVAPDENVIEMAGEIAVAGVALDGLAWGFDLLSMPGFRHDDPPEELSSIARQLLFDLIAGMLSQPRFGQSVAHGAMGLPADTGWPAHSEQLTLLIAAVIEGRPALCRTFWSDADFLSGSLSSMLLNGRYPLRAELLPALLAALCADRVSGARAWAFAHALQRVCHCLPCCLSEMRALPQDVNQLRTEVALMPLGAPALALPSGAVGTCIAKPLSDVSDPTLIVEWDLPLGHAFDMAPRLVDAVLALLRAGPFASSAVQSAAAASLGLLVHAPMAHSAVELWQVLPPVTTLVELPSICAQLPTAPERSLLLLSLQLLASVAPHAPQQLARLNSASVLWSDTTWLPNQEHARHAAMLLQILHAVAVTVPRTPGGGARNPNLNVIVIITQLLPAHGGAPRDVPAHETTASLARLELAFTSQEDARMCAGGPIGWQLERKLRAFAVLIAVMDEAGAPPPPSSPAASVVACMLSSYVAHSAIVDVLRWSCGPLQQEIHRCRSACPTAALDACEGSAARIMLLVLAAALGLTARLLQARHGWRCELHDALLAPGALTGAQCVGKCMLLHDDVVEEAGVPRPSPTRSHDVALLELEFTVAPVGSASIPLCRLSQASIGPLAARCLALLCHAVPSAEVAGSLLSHLSHLGPPLSSTLRGWLEAAVRRSDACLRAALPPLLESGSASDCASAALQLLGAAAESQPLLFGMLTRGPMCLGQAVRVQSSCIAPHGGWGLLSRAHAGRVRAIDDGTIFVEVEGSSMWVGSRATQFEVCGQCSRSVQRIAAGTWEFWGCRKPMMESDEDGAPDLEMKAGAGGASAGPLYPLWHLLGTDASADSVSKQSVQPLQLQALLVISEIWRRPVKHASALTALRTQAALWEALGSLITDVASNAHAPKPAAVVGEAQLRRSLGVQILCRELALSSRPTLGFAAFHLDQVMKSVARIDANDVHMRVRNSMPDTTTLPSALLAEMFAHPHDSQRNEKWVFQLARRFSGRAWDGCEEAAFTSLAVAPFVYGGHSPVAVPCAPLVEMFLTAVMGLWAGGRSRLLRSTKLLDTEAIKLRAWHALETDLRAKESGRVTVTSSVVGVATASTAFTAEEVIDATSTHRLLSREYAKTDSFLDSLAKDPKPGSTTQKQGCATAPPEHFQALLQVAATFNAACLAVGGDAALVHSWRFLLTMVCERQQACSSPLASFSTEASTRSSMNDRVTIEMAAKARMGEHAKRKEQAKEQRASARTTRNCVDTVMAANFLLTQQVLTLHSGTALSSQLVDAIMAKSSWQRHAPCNQLSDHTTGGASVQQTSAHRAERATCRETALLVLKALLNPASPSRPTDACEGWEVLRQLTTLMCGRMGAQSNLCSTPYGTPAYALTLATSQLKMRDSSILALAICNSHRLEGVDASLPDQLAILSKQLLQKTTAETGACTCVYGSVHSCASTLGHGHPAQSIPPRTPSRAMLNLALVKGMIEGMATRRASQPLECDSQDVVAGGVVPPYRCLISGKPASRNAWESTAHVHIMLREQLMHLSLSMTKLEHASSACLRTVVEALMDEQVEESVCTLADCQHGRSNFSVQMGLRSFLWARVHGSARLFELLLQHNRAMSVTEVPMTSIVSNAQSNMSSLFMMAGIDTLLCCEKVRTLCNRISVEDKASGLERRAALLHHVVVALRHACTGTTKSVLTLELQRQSHLSFLLYFGSSSADASSFASDPDWNGEIHGSATLLASRGLCVQLWPLTNSASQPLPGDSAWYAFVPAALRALALSVASELASHARVTSQRTSIAEAMAMMLHALRVLLRNAARHASNVPQPITLLSANDSVVLLEHITSALLALPAELESTAQLLGCAVFILLRHEQLWQRGSVCSPLPLAQKLCVHLATASSQPTSETQLSVLSFVLPLMPAAIVDGAATRLLGDVLHAANSRTYSQLPVLLRVVRTLPLAQALLSAGLLIRLVAFLVTLPTGFRYTPAGLPVDEHAAWCTGLAVAASALMSIEDRAGRATCFQATEFVNQLRKRLRLAVVADRTALGVREQHAALRLLEQVARIVQVHARAIGLLELLRLGLTAVTNTLLSTTYDMQRAVRPVSADEHRLAATFPSVVNSMGAASELSVFSLRLRALLQSSLCAAVASISAPCVSSGQQLTDLGEVLLAATLRAALRCMQQSRDLKVRAAALMAAQSCIGVFGALTLHFAREQLAMLQCSVEITAASQSRRIADSTMATGHLQAHTNELRRLPAALQSWVVDAMDAAGLEDARTRREILAPLGDVLFVASLYTA